MLKILGTVILALAGGIFYRMGGSGNFPRWVREAGQGLCVVLEFWLLGLLSWAWQPLLGALLAFGVCWAESTYFKKKGADAKWWNWLLVGLVFGLVPLPYCLLTQSRWTGFGIRLALCPGLTVLWQEFLSSKFCDLINWIIKKLFFKTVAPITKDITDEVGRGFINIATLPLLLI